MAKYSNLLIQWVVTVSLSIISLSGVILSLACIYALPDRSVNLFAGSFYFFCATFICLALISYSYLKEKNYIKNLINESNSKEIIFNMGISDKLIKWATILMAFIYILSSVFFSFICIYALPNNSSSPTISALFFSCGLFTLIFLIWRIKKIN